mgnify:CR=1 FL=1
MEIDKHEDKLFKPVSKYTDGEAEQLNSLLKKIFDTLVD